MSHSHLFVRHLIRQLELRGRQTRRRAAPEWLADFLADAADLLETSEACARAGYECWPTEHGWHVNLFLGANERRGGPQDGLRTAPGFDLDVHALLSRFESVERLIWSTRQRHPEAVEAAPTAWLTLVGVLGGHRLRLQVSDRSPPESEAGLSLPG